MDYETMRLRCLELATQQGFKGAEAVREAERMMQFARRGDVGAEMSPAPKARAVGKDGDLDPPFSDYLRSKE